MGRVSYDSPESLIDRGEEIGAQLGSLLGIAPRGLEDLVAGLPG